jgi:hypothetical protein
MTHRQQGLRCWPAIAAGLMATLAMVAGFLAPALSPAAAASTTSTTTTTAVPGSVCSASVSGTAFDRTGWVASTNAASSSADAPAKALDGDLATRFSTNENQAPGLYFEVDLGSARTFDALQMSVPGSPTDYARGYDVQVSVTGTSWTTVATCTGTATPETVGFSVQTVRYVKVVLDVGTSSDWWSIDELNLYGGPVITSAASLRAVSGEPNTLTITTTGSPVPVLSLSGSLPPGLVFKANSNGTAIISGTPPTNATGTYEVTITATNGVGSPAVQHLVLTLATAPVITSAASLRVVSGRANTFTITTTGSPVPVLSESGTLPPGLAFTANTNGTAMVSGTPPTNATGTYEVTITATNGVGSPAVQHLVLTLATAPAITSASGWRVLPGRYNAFTVTAAGLPVPTLSLSGTLPPGLAFTAHTNGTATISGTPPSAARGTYEVTITATNGVGSSAVQYLALTLGAAPVITSVSTWRVLAGRYNAFTVTTTGAPAPVLSLSGTLPSGLVFKANSNGTATISGTPPANTRGTYAVTITATNGVGSPAVQYLVLSLGGAPVITSVSTWRVLPGQYNAFTVTTTGSPVPVLSLSGTLPPGLGFRYNNNGTATISGTVPAYARGTYEATITATNGVGSPAVQYLVLSLGGAPVITSVSGWRVLPGQYNAFTVTTTGSPVPVLSVSGTLPSGLVFRDNKNGTATISGTPPSNARGTFEVSITATNGVGSAAVQYLVIALGGTRTTTSLSASANPAPVGQAIAYEAKVTPVTNGGIVNFFANGAVITGCRDIAVSTRTGTATCSTNYTSIGGRRVEASYSGDAAFGPSTSAVYTEVINHPAAGYWLATANGAVYGLGAAPSFGGVAISATTGRVVGIAATPDAKGYWVVTANGMVGAFGDAKYYGDLLALGKHVSDIVAIAPTSNGRGYYLVGADGGFFTFGDAKFHGSLPGIHIHVKDVVGMVASPNGKGYLLVGSDGGVFAFGHTRFYGSLPGIGKHVHDIRAILPSSTGRGYILVGSDGGVFNFGTGARFHGSLPGEGVRVSNIVGIALTPDNGGYYMASTDGHIYGFGDAQVWAAPAALPSNLPVAAIAGT